MFAYDDDISLFHHQHTEAQAEIDMAIVGHMLREASRRGAHGERRRQDHATRGMRRPRLMSERLGQERDTRQENRFAMAEALQEAAVTQAGGFEVSTEPMDMGENVALYPGAACYEPAVESVEEDDYDWYGALPPGWAEDSIL